MMKKITRIGITGGIGSGKSLVSGLIEENGFKVLRSDIIAKELITKDENLKKKVIKTFGTNAVISGRLNTKFLAEKIFSSKKNVEKINAIVHPPTIKRIEELINIEASKSKIIFVESALIYEAKIQKMFDYIILVYSDPKLRIERVVKRDKVEEADVLKRMKFQSEDEKKKGKADFVIENNSTLENLKNNTAFVLGFINSLTD
ncbi:MAG: dephospho-CoA kinase [Melioribacteraceae bacterium]|jgi:dephospho-CoA kinase|nr:dephospho-CoA kinase [Melioribacteraceae bacterium]